MPCLCICVYVCDDTGYVMPSPKTRSVLFDAPNKRPVYAVSERVCVNKIYVVWRQCTKWNVDWFINRMLEIILHINQQQHHLTNTRKGEGERQKQKLNSISKNFCFYVSRWLWMWTGGLSSCFQSLMCLLFFFGTPMSLCLLFFF